MKRIATAIQQYRAVAGVNALQPNIELSTVSRNGTVFLKNVNGPLAVVTSKGLIFDRIGGNCLNTPNTNRKA